MFLTELCQNLRNWFDRGRKKWIGNLEIRGGDVLYEGSVIQLKEGQFFRIVGSDLNDGVYQYGNTTQLLLDDDEGVPDALSFSIDDAGHLIQTSEGAIPHYRAQLTDEVFTGAVWEMGIPPAVLQLADEIEEWQNKYGGADSAAMSPFNSESFGGYSYSKSTGGGGSGSGSGSAGSWQSVFASRLNPWRKI